MVGGTWFSLPGGSAPASRSTMPRGVLVVPDEVPVPMSRYWQMPCRATYRTARRSNIRFSIAIRRMLGKTASMASPEARSAAK
jgi:hypothetical protein